MGFNWIDGLIVVAYLIAITLFGIHFRRKQQSIRTYFLGGKTIPAWALSLSIVATKVPRFLEFRDEFPRSAIGRIQKNMLKVEKENLTEGCYDRPKETSDRKEVHPS